jgi:hypothetical protein
VRSYRALFAELSVCWVLVGPSFFSLIFWLVGWLVRASLMRWPTCDFIAFSADGMVRRGTQISTFQNLAPASY